MEQELKRLPITNDYIFKRVFSYDGNEEILKDFLEAILNIKINEIQIRNPELLKTYKEDKLGILDIKVETDDKKVIDIEMQMKDEKDIPERSTTYLSKLVSEQLESGNPYSMLKETIVIFILNFNLYKRNSYHSIGRLRFDKTTKEAYVDLGYKKEDQIASKYMQIHIIELPKFRKKNPEMKGRVNQWLWLLSGKEEKLEKIDNQKVKQAIETLDRISLNPEERALYDSMVMARFLQKVRMTKNYEEGIEKRN